LVVGNVLSGGGGSHILRAALLVALAALLETTLSPLLTFGWVGPRILVIGVVAAVMGLRDLQALLLGFFGGVLTDALGGGHFGMAALGGVLAAAISIRIGTTRRKGETGVFLARAVAVAVVAYDLLSLIAPVLAGQEGPPVVNYLVGGVVPDVLLNAVLAYFVGDRLLRLITTKEERWI
jgi:rod shape-determining protein MreD